MRNKQPKPVTAIVLSDIHIPFADTAALEVAKKIIKDLNPDILILNGDILDCYSISSFSKDPLRIEDLQYELTEARTLLGEFARLLPKAKRYIFEGNHEARLGKVIASLDGPARELAKLDVFQEALSWSSLLRLYDKWIWVPESKQPKRDLIPGFLVKHGTVVRKFSGYSAKGEFDTFHTSGTSGHTHRLSHFYQTDFNGTHQWLESGCLCSKNAEYIKGSVANWQNGFAVFQWYEGQKIATPELIYIDDNKKALFRGKLYNA